eukprot:CAMPEP_0197567324 /NCGR_PEP_ID=MMETSP1320-20131121/35420_1 /TAXON_ID=91990 /ORGANISM="Bolidomonas sp., Strain RCC2347" /LENGTH=42 /DNA_ID= /DNA_START= /DNA_END= /DNA_ORIENTATION=
MKTLFLLLSLATAFNNPPLAVKYPQTSLSVLSDGPRPPSSSS